MHELKYLQGYPSHLTDQISTLIRNDKLKAYLLNKYPEAHQVQSEKSLYDFVMALKNQYLRKSAPISKVAYDSKIHVVNHALGLHSFVSRVHGNKVKAKNEIRVSTLFKQAPEPMLRMIVVHELAHIREKEHNKAFYQLCCHMEPHYHQLEFDTRLLLTQMDQDGSIYSTADS
ncbi:M48 family peptidase [Photobacterium ganghwense]|uniref:Metal-dependent hydrolase n=1 Tax=Photobacterium ganghwense TaxID=320778 RepID=A0A0J1HFI1_9GAMM|nr:M48 family metallopeptidase [Photobacterium ganghwense]KLV10354.1 metal-dependent hydrolase [Photobacterium ganghwense]PSU09749.1 M48 family peptidase [Photobacterium ganghwense]QSV16998.1 M48 family metallopeptidase [Photobacterium ganghwense]